MNFRESKNMEMASHHAWRIQRLKKEINKYILEHTLQFPKSPPAAGLHLCQFEVNILTPKQTHDLYN